ncbi:transglutaminase-like cysteine peptidase [Rhizobium sp. BE258]|uniref:transglutaminase-like cysteine peptidase n=1 Tax=Rhizobium sp. BE258 TaxID=2817722 RepID=UPI00286BEAA6|nr:transglutaminase-like cysteine peptidase [Rhizobium sp. BE258]
MASTTANAVPYPNAPSFIDRLPQAARIVESRPQPTPIGYVIFCMTYANQCNRADGGGRVHLDQDTWTLLDNVNRKVNDRIAPDAQKGTAEWSLTTTSGNCNDYAVQKRNELIERGISPSALSLSVVKTRRNEGHLILTVRTDHGDYVLDNLRNGIVAWDRTDYRWISVQSNDNPNNWVRVSARF